jgi:DNA-binding Lrp family transcriptional regulator
MSETNTDMSIDAVDRQLVILLRENARQPITSLAHALGLSRASVYARLQRLERDGIIAGYTIRLGTAYDQRMIRAQVMLKVAPRLTQALERKLIGLPELVALHAISGEYDMIALVEAEGVAALNDVVDRIGLLEGVEKTTTSILMATKMVRGEG